MSISRQEFEAIQSLADAILLTILKSSDSDFNPEIAINALLTVAHNILHDLHEAGVPLSLLEAGMMTKMQLVLNSLKDPSLAPKSSIIH